MAETIREIFTIYAPEDIEETSRDLSGNLSEDVLYELHFVSGLEGCRISMLPQFLSRHASAAARLDRLTIAGSERLPLPEVSLAVLADVFRWTPALTELTLVGVAWVGSEVGEEVRAPPAMRNLYLDGVICRSQASVLEVLGLHDAWNRVRILDIEHYENTNVVLKPGLRIHWLAVNHRVDGEYTDVAARIVPLVERAKQLTLHGQERLFPSVFPQFMERLGSRLRQLHVRHDRHELCTSIVLFQYGEYSDASQGGQLLRATWLRWETVARCRRFWSPYGCLWRSRMLRRSVVVC